MDVEENEDTWSVLGMKTVLSPCHARTYISVFKKVDVKDRSQLSPRVKLDECTWSNGTYPCSIQEDLSRWISSRMLHYHRRRGAGIE